jgi:hypothetical protein
MTPKSQFATPDLKSTQSPRRPVAVCKQYPVTRSTRYLSQQPAQLPSSQQPPPTNPNKPIARSHPSSCPLHVLRYTKTAPYLAPRTSLLPTTLRHHQLSTVTRQQTWLTWARKIDGVAASQTWSQAWGLGAGRMRAEYWGWARVGVRVR